MFITATQEDLVRISWIMNKAKPGCTIIHSLPEVRDKSFNQHHVSVYQHHVHH